MEKALTKLCYEVNNYFKRSIHVNKMSVTNGSLTWMPAEIQDGQYFRIVGSVFNDGVHKYPATKLTNEAEFQGAIWLLAIPADFVDLANKIDEWETKYGGVESPALSPFNSESFGNYSYSKGGASSGGANGTTNPNSWQSVFASEISKYRRMRGLL